MKDVGSIFPLYKDDLNHNGSRYDAGENRHLFSLCREALFVIAENEKKNGNVVLLPAYTCDTVITPFLECGWECHFYSINKDLTINLESVKTIFEKYHPNLFLTHPYYGMDLADDEVNLLQALHDKNVRLIVDLTQCIYSAKHYDFVDYYVGSYRKWYQVPDGGYLQSKKEISCGVLEENASFVQQQTDAMYLRGLYFTDGDELVKQISIRLNKSAVASVDFNVKPHAISSLSRQIMADLNHESFARKRMQNYMFLFDNIAENECVEFVCKDKNRVTTAPLYFVIYSPFRKELQKELAEQHIYAPVIWPVYYTEVVVDDTIKQIYDTILAIPVDQRYGWADMKRITEIINNFHR